MPTMTEKDRRVYWQDLCYHAMLEIDKAYGRKVSAGEGTTEDTFKADMTRLRETLDLLHEFVAAVDTAFESNKRFMWGDGKFSVLSKIRVARRRLDK